MGGQWFYPGNKTDHQRYNWNIVESVVVNTITPNQFLNLQIKKQENQQKKTNKAK